MTTDSKHQPLLVIRDGALKDSIWRNKGANGRFLSTVFARTYTSGGEPKDSHTFGRGDLLALAELARKAYFKTGPYGGLETRKAEAEKRTKETPVATSQQEAREPA